MDAQTENKKVVWRTQSEGFSGSGSSKLESSKVIGSQCLEERN